MNNDAPYKPADPQDTTFCVYNGLIVYQPYDAKPDDETTFKMRPVAFELQPIGDPSCLMYVPADFVNFDEIVRIIGIVFRGEMSKGTARWMVNPEDRYKPMIKEYPARYSAEHYIDASYGKRGA